MGLCVGNHSPHGQAASIWTEDLTLALESAKRSGHFFGRLSVVLICSFPSFIFFSLFLSSLCVGSVWVNCHSVMDPALPLCGRRDSGNCTDGGREVAFLLCSFVNSEFTFFYQSGAALQQLC